MSVESSGREKERCASIRFVCRCLDDASRPPFAASDDYDNSKYGFWKADFELIIKVNGTVFANRL